MGIKDDLQKKGLQLMGDPRVAKLMQDERFMKAFMAAISVPGKVNAFTTEQTERFAQLIGVPTLVQFKELERQVKNLEAEIARLKQRP
jgi:phosphoribosylamine-glycine ligase